LLVTTSVNTDFRKNNGTAATFADLAPGLAVDVRGQQNDDGSIAAGRVLIIVVQRVGATGTVVGVNAAALSFVLQRSGRLRSTVLTNANTDFRKNDGTGATFADIAAGEAVQVTGIQNTDGSIAADRVVLLVARHVAVSG